MTARSDDEPDCPESDFDDFDIEETAETPAAEGIGAMASSTPRHDEDAAAAETEEESPWLERCEVVSDHEEQGEAPTPTEALTELECCKPNASPVPEAEDGQDAKAASSDAELAEPQLPPVAEATECTANSTDVP